MGVLEFGTDGSTVPLKQKITVFQNPMIFLSEKENNYKSETNKTGITRKVY